jgi:hypothetical protein
MYSYVIEFNLEQRGDDAQEYLAEAARVWPKLWGDISGVTGTLLLSNAFALGGEFEYQWRVDIETLGTLSRVDAVMKSGEGGWRKTRRDWFKARTAARAHVSNIVAGDEQYCQNKGGRTGTVHFVFHSAAGESADRLRTLGSVSGVIVNQSLRPLVGSAVSDEQTWARLESLDSLDGLAEVDLGTGRSQLFGEIRELDGALFAGA